MSFSQSVKEEIFKKVKKVKGCCATSFLTAVLKSAGSLCVANGSYSYSLDTDNGDLLTLCCKLAQSEFGVDSEIFQINPNEKNTKYSARFDAALGDKLSLTYLDSDGAVHISNNLPALHKECCRKAFMQALFLSCGSATIPETAGELFTSSHSNYHLELRFTNADFANYVLSQYPEILFKQTERKKNIVLYLKDSNIIADFFVYVEAINAKFTVENVIIGRSYRNAANRESNCIESNINKAVVAGAKQIAAITKIRQSGKFELLPQNLKDIAIVRENNPEANLSELAAILGISKSGVNHRLEKLIDIAENT